MKYLLIIVEGQTEQEFVNESHAFMVVDVKYSMPTGKQFI